MSLEAPIPTPTLPLKGREFQTRPCAKLTRRRVKEREFPCPPTGAKELIAQSKQACAALSSSRPRSHQGGVVLLVALIVLVAMTIAGLALMRSTTTTNLIAGNLAFHQAATSAADLGVETAHNWLAGKGNASLKTDDTANGYSAAVGICSASPPAGSYPCQEKGANDSWEVYWKSLGSTRVKSSVSNGSDGNSISYAIHRLCTQAGDPNSVPCAQAPVLPTASGQGVGEAPIEGLSPVYYRVTVRVQGPRNTVSFIQNITSLPQ